jgi:hypothetical protein
MRIGEGTTLGRYRITAKTGCVGAPSRRERCDAEGSPLRGVAGR